MSEGVVVVGGGHSNTRAKLLAKPHGVSTIEEFPLGDRSVIGRFDPNLGPVDIDLAGLPEASTVSRRHAEIYRDAVGQWYVRDLGSTNGVFIRRAGGNEFGPRITGAQPIRDGDELAFGNARVVFKAGIATAGERQTLVGTHESRGAAASIPFERAPGEAVQMRGAPAAPAAQRMRLVRFPPDRSIGILQIRDGGSEDLGLSQTWGHS